MNTIKKRNLILLTLATLFLLALACGSGSGGQSKEEAAPVEEKPATMGQDVMVGDVRWKILEAKDLGPELKSDNEFVEPKSTSGKFVLVRVEVENRKSEAATYGGISLVDDKNRTFEHYAEMFGYIDDKEACVLEQLNPNLTKVCSEVFELPADAKGIKAKLGDLEIFGSKETLVDLGF